MGDPILQSAREKLARRDRAFTSEEAAAISRWQQTWLADHEHVIHSWNAWVDRHGLPLAKYRQF